MTSTISTSTLPKAGTYLIDPAHTEVGFIARHLIGTKVRGRFTDVQGTFTVSPDCTGAVTVHVFHGTTLARTSLLHMVWDSHQNEFRAIFLTAGTNISIQGRKMAEED